VSPRRGESELNFLSVGIADTVLARDWLDYAGFGASALAALGAVAAVGFAVAISARDVRNRARGQAAAITSWPGQMEPGLPAAGDRTLVISNGSSAAIYDVLVSYAAAWGNADADKPLNPERTTWMTYVPPGQWYFEGPENPGNSMDVRSGILAEFADATGTRWRRSANGRLRKIRRSGWRASIERHSKPSNQILTRLK